MAAWRAVDWAALELRLDKLFPAGCDPYRAGAAALFDKPLDAVTQDEREITKIVFMRMLAIRKVWVDDSSVQALRHSADMFHEIGSSYAAEDLSADVRNAKIVASLHEKLRSRDQLKRIAANGFEQCVRALATLGVPDVTIHECGTQALGETPWSGGDE